MAANLGYIYVSGSNGDTFTNALDSDMLLYPNTSNQRILIGNKTQAVASLTVGSNVGVNYSNPPTTLSVGGNLTLSNFGQTIIYASNNYIGIGASNPTAALTVGGGATITGDLTINNAVGIKGLTIYKRADINANISSTSVLGFSNDPLNGININTSNATNYIRFMSSNVEMARFNSNGVLQINSNIQTAPLPYRIWDFAGTAADTSALPGPVAASNIIGSNISVSATIVAFSNINTEGSIFLPGSTGNYIIAGPQPISGALPDFTIESWIHLPVAQTAATNNIPYLIGNMSALTTSGSNYWSFGINSSNQISFYGFTANGVFVTGSNVQTSNWNHIAICYSNAARTAQLFLNGTLQTLTVTGTGSTGNATTTAGFGAGLSNNSNAPLIIGQYSNLTTNAYITNLRYVNNVLYTSSFTPSPYPLQAYSNTTRLLLRAPTYITSVFTNMLQSLTGMRTHCLPSDAQFYIDCYGLSMPYFTSNSPTFDSNITKSIVFNRPGSNNLTLPPQTFNIATKGFTAVVQAMFTSNIGIWERFLDFGNGSNNNNIVFSRYNASNQLAFNFGSNNGGTTMFFSPAVISQNTIFTCAARYDPFTNGGTSTIWYNGSNIASSNAMAGALGADRVLNNVFIGQSEWGVDSYLNGNIYSMAVYNRALTDKEIIDASVALQPQTLPNAALLEVGNVNSKPALTVKQDGTVQIAGPLTATNNTGFVPQDFGVSNFSISGSIVGNVPATAMDPFNTTNEGSLYVSGSNYVLVQSPLFNTNWWLNGGFTCECWVNYPSFSNAASTNGQPLTIGNMSPGYLYWSLGALNSGLLSFFYFNGSLNNITGTTVMQTNTWYHIAVCYRDDTASIRVFLNGALQNSATISGTPQFSAANPFISINSQFTSISMTGLYITNARVVYGVALYAAPFSPPTGPLPPASTGRTALLLRVPQNTGRVLVPKLGGTTQVQAYPPAALTGYLTNVQNTAYGSGFYIVSASSEGNPGSTVNGVAFLAFDKTIGSGTAGTWYSASAYNGTTGVYTGSVSTVDIVGNSYSGEWIQIQMPMSINLLSYSIGCQITLSTYTPKTFYLLGSVDGNRWILVNQQSNITWSTGITIAFTTNTANAYNYFRLVCNTVGAATICQVSEWTLYGTQESITTTLDGQVGIGVSRPFQALEVAGNAIINGNISAGNLGMFRNRIINGDMRINQRGSTSYTCALSTTTYTVDRMNCYNGGGTTTVTVQALSSTDAPANVGFNTSIRYTTNSAAIILIQPCHYIEGLNISDFRWGTTNASPVVLSFWLKSSAAFTIAVSLRNANAGGTYTGYVNTVSSTTAWNYYTLQIPGATIGSWNTNTSTGLEIFIGGYSGVAGVSTMNVWSNNSGSISSTTSTRWDQTVGNYIEFTGLQLEKGTIATPFEFRPFAIELQLCQRYYVRITSTSSYDSIGYCMSEVSTTISSAQARVELPVQMRSQPTYLQYSGTLAANGAIVSAIVNHTAFTTLQKGSIVVTIPGTSFTAWVHYCLRFSNASAGSAYIDFTAEL
jgi:hypothetical protein